MSEPNFCITCSVCGKQLVLVVTDNMPAKFVEFLVSHRKCLLPNEKKRCNC